MPGRVEARASRPGRLVVGRLHPGTDLIRGLEQACDEHGIRFAAVLSCYGSLSAAGFKFLKIPDGEAESAAHAALPGKARRIHGRPGPRL